MKNELKKIKSSGFFADFRKFINRGNVVDMAVGLIVGSAFTKIVNSLVADIVTPLLSKVTGRARLTDLKWVLTEALVSADGTVTRAETAVYYGKFFQLIFDFLVIAFFVFLAVRFITRVRKAEERLQAEREKARNAETPPAAPPPPPEPSPTDKLLTEIRDLLKNGGADGEKK